MRKILTTRESNGLGNSDTSIATSFILVENENDIGLTIEREEAPIKSGSVKEPSLTETIHISADTTAVEKIASETNDFLESESRSTIFSDIPILEGEYERIESNPRRGGREVRREYTFDTVHLSVGETSVNFQFNQDDGYEGVVLPAAERVERKVPQDFKNIVELNRFFYDFYSRRYSGEPKTLSIEDPVDVHENAIQVIEQLFDRFNEVSTPLKSRRGDKDPVPMTDEYDVQFILHALLKLHFDTVLDESYLTEHAELSPRIDFMIPSEDIGIEVKRASENNRTRDIGKDLADDKEHYSADPDCSQLLVFIYDPENWIQNPRKLESDISEEKSNLTTRVTVTQ